MRNKNDDNDTHIAKLPEAGGIHPRPLVLCQAVIVAM